MRCASWSGSFTFYVCHVAHFHLTSVNRNFQVIINFTYKIWLLTDLISERWFPDRPVRCASWSGSFRFYVCHVVHFHLTPVNRNVQVIINFTDKIWLLTDLISERWFPDRSVRCASWSGSFTFYVCNVVHFHLTPVNRNFQVIINYTDKI